MPKPPLVSVLIPCYNREKYIRQCIDSVLTQDFQDFEIICSDNASTDGTWQILQSYAAADGRIRIFRNETNLGPMKNWERCLDNASGEYVHWLWSDDWVEHGFYTVLLDAMRRHDKRCALCACRTVYESGYSPISGSSAMEVMDASSFVTAMVATTGGGGVISPAAYLLPSEFVRKWFIRSSSRLFDARCYDRAIGPDVIMVLGSVYDAGGLCCVSSPYVCFRHHAASISVMSTTSPYYYTSYFYMLSNMDISNAMNWRVKLILLYRALRASSPVKCIARWMLIAARA